jgi:hypothetical protein
MWSNMDNKFIVETLVRQSSDVRGYEVYNIGRGVFIALEGEEVPEVPVGIFVLRVPADITTSTLRDVHRHRGLPDMYLTRYVCMQMSVGVQARMTAGDVERIHRGNCNIIACSPVIVGAAT